MLRGMAATGRGALHGRSAAGPRLPARHAHGFPPIDVLAFQKSLRRAVHPFIAYGF